jgi:hypothetical protein
MIFFEEEFDGSAVSELGVQLRKLSNFRKGRSSDADQKLVISRSSVFQRSVKSLVPAGFAVVSTC